MKISRKMKKYFASCFAAILSIVMVVTSVGAINAQTCSFWVEHEDFDALVQMTWYEDRDLLQLSVDLSCYEDANIDSFNVELDLWIVYLIYCWPNSTGDVYQEQYNFTIDSENTWDSDEIIISISDFERGCAYSTLNSIDVKVEITCWANYSDSSLGVAFNEYEATVFNGNFG